MLVFLFRLEARKSMVRDSGHRLAVAIPAYRRASFLNTVLGELHPQYVSRVYIAVDGPRQGAEADVAKTAAVADDFARRSSIPTLIRVRSANVGTAVNVLGAVDWMFSHEPIGAILEEDCIPSENFFRFVTAALYQYWDDPYVWMASGSQLAPSELISGTHVLSPYGLIWGWATTQGKWRRMFAELKSSLEFGLPSTSFTGNLASSGEAAYWRSGHRRSAQGFLDSWAMPVTATAIFHGRVGVLPPHNLVTNVGNDILATHTRDDTRWTHRPIGGHVAIPLGTPRAEDSPRVTQWLRSNLFRIGSRHLWTTQLTAIRDYITANPKQEPLLRRIALSDSSGLPPSREV